MAEETKAKTTAKPKVEKMVEEVKTSVAPVKNENPVLEKTPEPSAEPVVNLKAESVLNAEPVIQDSDEEMEAMAKRSRRSRAEINKARREDIERRFGNLIAFEPHKAEYFRAELLAVLKESGLL